MACLIYPVSRAYQGNLRPVPVFVLLKGYVPIVGEVGNYAHFENCYFQGNVATRFGAAIAISMTSGLMFGNRERINSTDLINW